MFTALTHWYQVVPVKWFCQLPVAKRAGFEQVIHSAPLSTRNVPGATLRRSFKSFSTVAINDQKH